MGIILLPEPMHNMDLDECADVLIKGSHEKVNVVKIVELPTFCNEGIPKEVFERDSVLIECVGVVADLGQLEG